jgi:outer membrane receptor protein involved in Fe transport
LPVDVCNPDIYRGAMQSRDLRTISSQLKPKYQADSDVFDLTINLELTDALSFTSQTVYAKDSYYATQDYNRFTAFPIWTDTSAACWLPADGSSSSISAATLNCSDDPDFGVGTYAPIPDGNGDFLRDEDGRRIGFYRDLAPRPEGSPLGTAGVFCDPQLGCSDTLLIQDLSQSTSKQFNQEFRLASNFDAPWNFSLGTNITRFETTNDYYVFANALTYLLNVFPFAYHNSQCVETSTVESYRDNVLNDDPYRAYDGQFCRYVDPNPLESINGEGHNYFRSNNPYKLTSGAVFGELYWEATETLKVTAGVRLTWDRKVFTPVPSQLLLGDYRETQGISPGDGPENCRNFQVVCGLAGSSIGGRGSPASPDIIQEWQEPTGRLVVSWSPDLAFTDETMIYGSISHGYKGGGANPPSVDVPAKFLFDRASGGFPDTFEAEFINAYEVGTKNTLFGGALVLNGTAFYYDYTDYQVSRIVDRRAVNDNFDAEVWGLEFESIFAPTLNWQFNAAIGYLNTEVAEGEQSIDLMDRTDGGNRHFAADPNDTGITANRTTDFPEGFDEWIVVQPWITSASNCIVPKQLMEANFAHQSRNFINAYCPTGNVANSSTVQLGNSYFDENGNFFAQSSSTDRRFYDPAKDAPNGGSGFFKDLGGNELPNAPKFTVALGGQYSFDLTRDWRATARMDYYWQDQSYARIYNMPDYDRLRSWSNTNLSFWVNNPVNGITVEAYVKNLFDETPITGAFLNSDDSGLTTNVFTLDPRLIGVSVRKEF